ncbi:MAG: peptide deformylase [Desulfatiglandales bacterium]
MGVREIKRFPETVLRKKAEPVTEIDGEMKLLVDDMIETMHSAPGVGLAAPQIGISLQVIVIDTSVGEDPDAVLVLLNPEIVSQSGSSLMEEGCLSVPWVAAELERFEKVTISGINLQGEGVEIEAEGLMARVFQHEIDHLNGSLYWDRLGKIKKEQLKREYKKMKSEMETD